MTKELTTEDAERWIDAVSDVAGISIAEYQRPDFLA